MINGLNTGGFDIQDQSTAIEVTDRALTMLAQYLISNESLELNSTFKVYLKILSVEHMKNLTPRRAKKRKFTGKQHVGCNSSSKNYNPKWAFEFLLTNFTDNQKQFLSQKA